MKLTKTILYVENETPDLILDTLEALQIIDAVSDTFSIFGKAANSISGIKEIESRVREKKAEVNENNSNGLSIFDNYNLDENLLIVTIGNQADLKVYVANRINSSTDQYGWHIINSTYARIGYLEKQKNLSNFIPYDTVRWLKEQIDKFGLGIFNDCLKTLTDSSVLILGEAIIDEYIKFYNIKADGIDTRHEALAWSIGRGSRSGRVAWQFITDLAARTKTSLRR
mgnify:CR=1 FL=1